ncbi:MAG: copper-binding protein [Zoogloea sp.]|nr:copper-binding protein [Zoogloea sp.]
MRRILAASALLAVLAAPSVFAGQEHGDHMAAAPAALSEGVVKKVDKAAGKLTLSHGPLTNLGMPGMTMAFAVADPAWLSRVKEGDKLRFLAEDRKGVLTVVRLEAAK